jgi:cell division transport system ATP-binding protein
MPYLKKRVAQVLSFSHVACQYPNGITLFRDLNFYIHAGDTVCFSAAEHGGKSLLLKMMSGLAHPTSGKVLFRHKNWMHLSASERHSLYKTIGFIGSPATLLADETVSSTLLLPLKLRGIRGKARYQRLKSILIHLELQDREHDPVHALSCHEQLRLSIGRAFIHRPVMVLADTPLSWFKEDEALFWEWVQRLRLPETALICTESQPMNSVDRIYLLSGEQWLSSSSA